MKKVAEVLEGLREEERRLSGELAGVRRAIAALEEVMGIVPARVPALIPERTERTVPPKVDAPAPADPSGPYALLGFYEAAAAYLTAGEPRSAREVAEALQAGGYRTQAKDFTATVRTMLSRHLSAEPFGIFRSGNDSLWFARTRDSDESTTTSGVE